MLRHKIVLIQKFIPAGGAILTITSFISYAMGFLRDRTFAQTFGAGAELDAYNASFIIPDLLLNIFVAGALAAGFIPVFSSLLVKNKGGSDPPLFREANQLASSIINSAVLTMFLGGVFIVLLAPIIAKLVAPGFSPENISLLTNLMRIMAISPIIFAISNTLGGMLVGYKKFLFYGISPALYNLGIIGGTLLLTPTFGIYGVAIGTIAGALLHLSIRIVGLRRNHLASFKYKAVIALDSNFKTVIRLMIPKMFGHPVELVTFWGFTAVASTLGEGSITALNFARNFQSVPVSLFGIAFATAVFPVLSQLVADNNYTDYKKQFLKTLRSILLFTGASAIFIFFTKTILIDILLGGGAFSSQNVMLTASVLGVFTLAIPTESINHLLARSFYALKNTAIPVATSIFALAIAVSFAYFFSPSLGIIALPLGFFTGSLFKAVSLFALLNLRIKLF